MCKVFGVSLKHTFEGVWRGRETAKGWWYGTIAIIKCEFFVK